jgi:hypothetical protein
MRRGIPGAALSLKDLAGSDAFETRIGQVAQSLYDALGEPLCWDIGVMYTFEDSVIVKNWATGEFFRIPYTIPAEGDVLFDQPVAVDEVFVDGALKSAGVADPAPVIAAMKAARPRVRLAAPIVAKNAEQQIVLGPALVPDEPDSDGDTVTAAKIEQVAHKFLEDFRVIDLDHTLEVGGTVVESYIAPYDMTFGEGADAQIVPAGSWMLGVKLSDTAWASVKSGEFGGFSIWGCRSDHAEGTAAAAKASNGTVMVNGEAHNVVTLAELGDDWLVPAVSVVKTPAVPKARFVMIKRAGNRTVGERLRDAFSALGIGAKKSEGGDVDEGRATLRREGTVAGKAEEGDMNEDRVKELIVEALKAHDEQLPTVVADAVKTALAEHAASETAAKAEGGGEGEGAETGEEGVEDALKTQVETLAESVKDINEGLEKVTKMLQVVPGKSRVVKGQDEGSEGDGNGGAAREPGMRGRDSFGRKSAGEVQ